MNIAIWISIGAAMFCAFVAISQKNKKNKFRLNFEL